MNIVYEYHATPSKFFEQEVQYPCDCASQRSVSVQRGKLCRRGMFFADANLAPALLKGNRRFCQTQSALCDRMSKPMSNSSGCRLTGPSRFPTPTAASTASTLLPGTANARQA